MNVFSTKLEADYIEMANQYLDSFDIKNVNEFKIVEKALSILKEENRVEINSDNENLKDKINSIKELIDNPDLYVQNPEHFEQFIAIIKTRIAAKISEIESLTKDQKEFYINQRKQLNEEIEANRFTMANSRPPEPGSEAHTVSLEAYLLEMQSVFNQNGFNDVLLDNPLFVFLLTIRSLDEEFFATHYQQLVQLSPTMRAQVLANPVAFVHLIKMGVSLNDIINLNDDIRPQFFENELAALHFLSLGVSLEEIVSADRVLDYEPEQLLAIQCLMKGAGGLPFSVINGLNQELKALLFSKPQNCLVTRSFIQKGTPFNEISKLEAQTLSYLLDNLFSVNLLLDNNISFNEIVELPHFLKEFVLNILNTCMITKIINNKKISFAQLMLILQNTGELSCTFQALQNILNLVEKEVTYEQLQSLELPLLFSLITANIHIGAYIDQFFEDTNSFDDIFALATDLKEQFVDRLPSIYCFCSVFHISIKELSSIEKDKLLVLLDNWIDLFKLAEQQNVNLGEIDLKLLESLLPQLGI